MNKRNKAAPYVSVLYYLSEMNRLETGIYGPKGSDNEQIVLGKALVFSKMLCAGIENVLDLLLNFGYYEKPEKENSLNLHAMYIALNEETRSEIEQHFQIYRRLGHDYQKLERKGLNSVEIVLRKHKNSYNDLRNELKSESAPLQNALMYVLFALLSANRHIDDMQQIELACLMLGDSLAECSGIKQESFTEQ